MLEMSLDSSLERFKSNIIEEHHESFVSSDAAHIHTSAVFYL